MSGLNLGTEAISCLRELQRNPYFDPFREHLAFFVYKKLHEAVSSPVDQRIEATAYARALRDVWVAFESAATEKPQRSVELPLPSADARFVDRLVEQSAGKPAERSTGRLAKAMAHAGNAGDTEGVL